MGELEVRVGVCIRRRMCVGSFGSYRVLPRWSLRGVSFCIFTRRKKGRLEAYSAWNTNQVVWCSLELGRKTLCTKPVTTTTASFFPPSLPPFSPTSTTNLYPLRSPYRTVPYLSNESPSLPLPILKPVNSCPSFYTYVFRFHLRHHLLPPPFFFLFLEHIDLCTSMPLYPLQGFTLNPLPYPMHCV